MSLFHLALVILIYILFKTKFSFPCSKFIYIHSALKNDKIFQSKEKKRGEKVHFRKVMYLLIVPDELFLKIFYLANAKPKVPSEQTDLLELQSNLASSKKEANNLQ